MRNGMSVKEIYDKLDQLDRLKVTYEKEQDTRLELENIIIHLAHTILRTSRRYNDIAAACLEERRHEDASEFAYRSKGLIECGQVLVQYLTDAGLVYILDRTCLE